jgi:hypothetical protein
VLDAIGFYLLCAAYAALIVGGILAMSRLWEDVNRQRRDD